MNLYARSRIQLDCTTACNAFESFNFATTTDSMFTSMNSVWHTLKVMVYVAWILTFIGFCVLLYVISLRSRADQNKYAAAFLLALVIALVLLIFCCVICYNTSKSFNATRSKFDSLSKCILDPNWKKVPTKLHASTNMDQFHNWMIAWVVIFSIHVLVGICTFIYVSG